MGFWKDFTDGLESPNKGVRVYHWILAIILPLIIVGIVFFTTRSIKLGKEGIAIGDDNKPVTRYDSADLITAPMKEIPGYSANPMIYTKGSIGIQIGIYNTGNEKAIDLVDSVYLIYTYFFYRDTTILFKRVFDKNAYVAGKCPRFLNFPLDVMLINSHDIYFACRIHYTDSYGKKGLYQAIFNASRGFLTGEIYNASPSLYDSISNVLILKGYW